MSAERLNQVVGYLSKEESVYGTAVTLDNAVDGVLAYLAEGDPEPPTPIDYVFPGDIGRSPGTLAPAMRAAPNGRFRQGVFRTLFRGRGALYSAPNAPPAEFHRWMKAAGFDATFSATPTPQYLYTPTPAGTTFTSLTHREFLQGSQYDQVGVIADWSFAAEGLGVPIHEFNWRGLVTTLPTDQALPAITYPFGAILPPVSAAVAETIGAWTAATIKSVRYASNRSIDNPRIAQNLAGGHAGFVPGMMAPELTIVVERTARATYNAESVRDAATSAEVFVTYGTVQYNRMRLRFPTAQLINVVPANEGPVATMELTFRAHPSAPGLNDFVEVLVN